MVGLRRTYVTIMGIMLISYGIILNMLGAMASFLHPGSYHNGAMGTPMWCGLAFIIFGAVNIVKGMERKREKHGIALALPITNLLTAIVSTLCIALISWSMSAPGIVILSKHPVTQFSVTSQYNTTDGDRMVSDLQLSLIPVYSTIISSSLILLLMALISLCMDCVGLISQARPAVTAEVHHGKGWDERDGPRRTFPITEDEVSPPYHHGDAIGEVMYGNTPPVQVVKTIERPSFHHHMERDDDDNHRAVIPYHAHHQQDHAHQPNHTHLTGHSYQPNHTHLTGHAYQPDHAHQPNHTHLTGHAYQPDHAHQPNHTHLTGHAYQPDHAHQPNHTHLTGHAYQQDHAHQPNHTHLTGHTYQPDHAHQQDHAHQVSFEHGQARNKQMSTHQPLPSKRDAKNRQYPYQPNSAPNLREIERVERRPNPYFYL